MTAAARCRGRRPRPEKTVATAAVDTPDLTDPHPDWPDGTIRTLMMLEHHHPMPEGYRYAPVGISHHTRYVNWIEPDSGAIAPSGGNVTGTGGFR